jgi:hypothetical protein
MQSIGIAPNNGFVEDTPDLKVTVIEIECPQCKPEDTFPKNYQDKQKPSESDIIFPPRIQ